MPSKYTKGFDVYSRRLRQVFDGAQSKARRLCRRDVTREHLLWSLLQQEEGGAARILTKLGADRCAMSSSLESGFSVVENDPWGFTPLLSPRAKKVVRTAVYQASLAKLQRVGTEHLLAGLLDADEGRSVDLLHAHRVTRESVLEEIRLSGLRHRAEQPRVRRTRSRSTGGTCERASDE